MYVDCANGVGAPQLEPLVQHEGLGVKIERFNVGPGTEALNEGCGAEHCQKKRCPAWKVYGCLRCN